MTSFFREFEGIIYFSTCLSFINENRVWQNIKLGNTSAESWGIAGHSMGAYGAIYLIVYSK